MREVKLSSGVSVEVRALTKRERRQAMAELTPESAEAVMERVIALVLDPVMVEALEDMPYGDTLAVYRAVMAETHGVRDEEKISLPAGSGSRTPGGSTTAPAAANGPAGSAPPTART